MFEDILGNDEPEMKGNLGDVKDTFMVWDFTDIVEVEINWSKKTVKLIPKVHTDLMYEKLKEVDKTCGDKSPFEHISNKNAKVKNDWQFAFDVSDKKFYIDKATLNNHIIENCWFNYMIMNF